MFGLPIVVKAKANDSTNDVIRKFKKATTATEVVEKAKERAFYQKPSQVKAVRKNEIRRAKKRLLSMKKMKNVDPESLERLAKQL